jgi:hypothetical protein
MMADKETFCSSRQQDVGTGLIDRLARSAHTLDGERQLVKRRRWITGCILDRQTATPAAMQRVTLSATSCGDAP